MVVVSDDILSMPAAEIEKTRVETTVFDGKVIYRRSAPEKRVQ
jgi:predicted amidohydrolase YtcJ